MQNKSIKSRLTTLVSDLARATNEGMLTWVTSDIPGAFTLSRPQGTASIGSIDGDGTSPFEFVIFDVDGVEIESLRESLNIRQAWDDPLRQLFEAARASALNITDALDAWEADVQEFDLPF